MARVCDQEDHARGGKVALLAGDPTLECLDVGEMRLGLNQCIESLAAHDTIGAAAVAFDRHRNFGSPPNAWSEPPPEALEQGEVASIANGISIWVESDAQLQPENGRHASGKVDIEGGGIASLSPGDTVMADAHLPPDLAQTQAAGSTGVRETFCRPVQHAPRPSGPTICR